jgi:small multidrug resistance pump
MQSWLILIAAIVAEVIGTTSLKLSEGFTRWLPSLIVVLGYVLAFYLLALALKRIEVSVAYAIWSGLGTALIAIIGILFFKETLNAMKVFSLLLIIAGVVGLQLGGSHR